MENQLINDPQQYCEEWFNIANIGKEFELPNISNTFNHPWIENDYMAMPNNSLQNPINQTNPLSMDVACDTVNQYFPLPSAGATPVSVENQQVVTTSLISNPSLPYGPSLPISRNQICVRSISTTHRYGLSSLLTMRNQLSHVPIRNTISLNSLGINFPTRNLHTHVHSFSNPRFLYYQQPRFSGIRFAENPIPYPNHGILRNITAPYGPNNWLTVNPIHTLSNMITSYSFLNSLPMLNRGNQPINVPTFASTSHSFSNDKLMSNQANHNGPRSFDASVLIRNQETNAPNDHIIRPIQEPLALNDHLIRPKQEPYDPNHHLINPKQEPNYPSQASSSQLNFGLQNRTKKPSSPSKDSTPKIQENLGKRKTIESQSEVKRDHKCFECNLSFASGHALGGHMSSHAKKRKMEALRNDLQFLKSDQPILRFGDSQGVRDGSAQRPNASTSKTSDSVVAADEKIEGSEPPNEQEEKSTKIKVRRVNYRLHSKFLRTRILSSTMSFLQAKVYSNKK